MASTPDMAPNRSASTRSAPARRAANGPRRSTAASRAAAAASSREDELAAQIQQLQSDIKAIASSVAGLAEEKVGEARSVAKREAKNLASAGQDAIEEVQDEFSQLERQLKDSIREKPLTAVAGAIALGFVLAVVTR